MPIGKNAIKRVENNGYSKVETSAPDMENSHVIANPDPQVVEKMIAPVEEKPVKKTATKKMTTMRRPLKIFLIIFIEKSICAFAFFMKN